MKKALTTQPKYQNASLPVAARVQDLLEQMTLDEKLAQLTSYWFNELQVDQKPAKDKMQGLLGNGIGQVTRVGGSSTLAPAEVAEAGNEIQRFLLQNTRLGIPAIFHEECCSGYMGLGGTTFPQMIGLASTWDTNLAEQMAAEIRRQLLAIGARQGLSPVLDIATDPRWGRTEETFGEDPFLVSQFGMAYIRGLQGEDMRTGLLATGKHFVGHSLSLGGLNCGPVQLGPRSLWDVYLMPFQAAIKKAGLRSMMNAYPELDGEVVAASRKILTELLRDELGFEGLVVSDYQAVAMIHDFHRIAPDMSQAAVKAFKAGIDMELPTCAGYGDPLRIALKRGDITMQEIDAVVLRILQTKMDLGLFENPYVDEGAAPAAFETVEQRRMARELAGRSMVLLKNDGLLPLKAVKKLAVIGPNANAARHLLGDYSYASTFELLTRVKMEGSAFVSGVDQEHIQAHAIQVASILDGIRTYAGESVEVLYAPGCPLSEADRSGFDEAVQAARQADAVVLVLGDKAGMTPDCTCGEFRDRSELSLPGVQDELARVVVETGKPVVVVLVNGRPAAIPWLDEHAAAILEAWLPGEEGAAAVAEVLFGAVNPSGKLPISFPRTVGQAPVIYYHKPSGGRSHWYTDYVENPVTPLYPFGHGLSYTHFTYSNLRIAPEKAKAGEQVEISLTVMNSGQVRGSEVVQLYICDEYASIPRPVKELKGFVRLTLDAGESSSLTFHLPVDLLAFYDENIQLVVEAGKIDVMIGSSSDDIRLKGSFEITGENKAIVKERLFECPVTV